LCDGWARGRAILVWFSWGVVQKLKGKAGKIKCVVDDGIGIGTGTGIGIGIA